MPQAVVTVAVKECGRCKRVIPSEEEYTWRQALTAVERGGLTSVKRYELRPFCMSIRKGFSFLFSGTFFLSNLQPYAVLGHVSRDPWSSGVEVVGKAAAEEYIELGRPEEGSAGGHHERRRHGVNEGRIFMPERRSRTGLTRYKK